MEAKNGFAGEGALSSPFALIGVYFAWFE